MTNPKRLTVKKKVQLTNDLRTYQDKIPLLLKESRREIGTQLVDALDLYSDGAYVKSDIAFSVEGNVLTIHQEVNLSDAKYTGKTAMDDRRSDAYNDGVQDAIAGKKVQDNPFDLSGSRHGFKDWMKGWQDQVALILGVDISVLIVDTVPDDAPSAQETVAYAFGFSTAYEARDTPSPYPAHSYNHICWKDGYTAGAIKRKDEHSLIYRMALTRTLQDDALALDDNPYAFGTTDHRQWEAAYIKGRTYYAHPVFDTHWRTGWLRAFNGSKEGNPFTPRTRQWIRFNMGHSQGKVDRKRVGLI